MDNCFILKRFNFRFYESKLIYFHYKPSYQNINFKYMLILFFALIYFIQKVK